MTDTPAPFDASRPFRTRDGRNVSDFRKDNPGFSGLVGYKVVRWSPDGLASRSALDLVNDPAPASPATADAGGDLPTIAATSFCNEQFVIDLCSFKGEMTHTMHAELANTLALDTRGWLHGLVQEHVEKALAAHPVAAAPTAPGEHRHCTFGCRWMDNLDPNDDRRICAHCGQYEPASAAPGEAGESDASEGCSDTDIADALEELLVMSRKGLIATLANPVAIVMRGARDALARRATHPPQPADAKQSLEDACSPWKFASGEPPTYDSPLHQVFVAGMIYSERLLANFLDVKTYEGGDGSEDFDCDATKSLENILTAASLYDPEDGRRATLATQPADARVAELLRRYRLALVRGNTFGSHRNDAEIALVDAALAKEPRS